MKTCVLIAILALLLTGIAFLQVGVVFCYKGQELLFRMVLGKIKLYFPRKRNTGKEAEEKPKLPSVKKKEKRWKPWLKVAWDHFNEIMELIGRILREPTIDMLKIDIGVGNDDPEACALNYGRVCAAVGAALPIVESVFSIKKRHIDVQCRFDRSDLDLSFEAEVTLRIYEIILLSICLITLGLKLYRQAKNLKKVGH